MSVKSLLAGRRRTKSNMRAKDVWLLSHSLVKRFEQTGNRIDAKKDKTVNLHSRIDASGSSATHLNVSYRR